MRSSSARVKRVERSCHVRYRCPLVLVRGSFHPCLRLSRTFSTLSATSCSRSSMSRPRSSGTPELITSTSNAIYDPSGVDMRISVVPKLEWTPSPNWKAKHDLVRSSLVSMELQ